MRRPEGPREVTTEVYLYWDRYIEGFTVPHEEIEVTFHAGWTVSPGAPQTLYDPGDPGEVHLDCLEHVDGELPYNWPKQNPGSALYGDEAVDWLEKFGVNLDDCRTEAEEQCW